MGRAGKKITLNLLEGWKVVWVLLCMCAKLLQSCPTLCDPVYWGPPGSFVHGILQARILEWFAMPSSRESSPCRDWICVFCIAGRVSTAEPPGKSLQGEWSVYYLSWSFLRIQDISSNLKPSLLCSSMSCPGQDIAPSRCSIKHLVGTWTVQRMSGPQVRFFSVVLKIKFNKLCFAVKGIDWHV